MGETDVSNSPQTLGVYKDKRDPSAQFKGPRKSCNLGIYRHPAETLGTEDEIH